jgi:hypothetical protein
MKIWETRWRFRQLLGDNFVGMGVESPHIKKVAIMSNK